MRKLTTITSIMLIAFGMMGITSCSKSPAYKCANCATTPEANAAHDNNSGGVYKGVIVGSTGTIKFDVANDGSSVSAVMIIDGITVNLTSVISWQSGMAYVGAFTGTLNNQPVSITLSVDLSGANPTVTAVNIPGHPNATLDVFKETSNNQVVCFLGTYTGTSSGVFNMVLSTTIHAWTAVTREDGQSTTTRLDGTLNNNSFSCTTCSNGSSVTGTLNGDVVGGNWGDGGTGSGTWTGNKTL